MNPILKKHRSIWKNKKILRDIYQSWYQQIIHYLSPGSTLELGSGTGNFKQYFPSVITSDIIPCKWLDKCFDAHSIPFDKNSLGNIVMIDVFHHLQNPIQFLSEAYRVLNKKGRILLIEPFPSPISLIIYKLFHPEPFIFNIDYFSKSKTKIQKNPWDSNQAIPYLIFFKYYNQFSNLFSNKFKLIKKDKFSTLTYPLSGGFENKQLLPDKFFPMLQSIENILNPILKHFAAFRCFIIIEKID